MAYDNPAEPAQPVRRDPKQSRARTTKQAIVEATIQLLESEGEAAFNTNRIAGRAGVSVGTLYQYFARKEDILIELAMVQTAKHRANNERLKSEGLSVEAATRASVHFYINALKDHPVTRRMAVNIIRKEATPGQMGKSTDTTASLLPHPQGATRTDGFILSRAIMGTVQAAVLEDFEGLYTRAFEDGIMGLIENYRLSRDLTP